MHMWLCLYVYACMCVCACAHVRKCMGTQIGCSACALAACCAPHWPRPPCLWLPSPTLPLMHPSCAHTPAAIHCSLCCAQVRLALRKLQKEQGLAATRQRAQAAMTKKWQPPHPGQQVR